MSYFSVESTNSKYSPVRNSHVLIQWDFRRQLHHGPDTTTKLYSRCNFCTRCPSCTMWYVKTQKGWRLQNIRHTTLNERQFFDWSLVYTNQVYRIVRVGGIDWCVPYFGHATKERYLCVHVQSRAIQIQQKNTWRRSKSTKIQLQSITAKHQNYASILITLISLEL